MSTDWEKYSTPVETQERAPMPEANGVVSLAVAAVRKQARQVVNHAPLDENRAHTDVIGDKKSDPETRMTLARIAHWVIQSSRI
jgi:hypothetical protein